MPVVKRRAGFSFFSERNLVLCEFEHKVLRETYRFCPFCGSSLCEPSGIGEVGRAVSQDSMPPAPLAPITEGNGGVRGNAGQGC